MASNFNLCSQPRTATSDVSPTSAAKPQSNRERVRQPGDCFEALDAPAYRDADTVSCGECEESTIISEDGVAYCDGCGVVVSEGTLERSEPGWTEDSDRRLGPQQSTLFVNTGTVITSASAGNPRFTRYNDRLTNSERSLASGLREIRSISAKFELPEPTRERAAFWYRKATKEELLTGRSLEALAAACVFLAAREQHQPVTIDWLADYSPMEASTIRHHVQVLRSELTVSLPPSHPRDFLSMLISRLSLGMDAERRATACLERVTDDGVHVGKHPVAIAATVIYAAAQQTGVSLTQQAVADAADVSTVTISRHYQEIQAPGE